MAAYRADARELVLQVSQRLAKATDWAESGYELAFGQTVVPADATATPDTKPADGTITVGRWNAGVRGAGREVLLSRTQGGMSPTPSPATSSCCAVPQSPPSVR